jgi:hypothetical protein
MPDEPNPQKKIIVDEDWKSQVEAEREAVKQQAGGAAAEAPAADDAQGESVPWPEPSLPLLVTTLATQTMAAMGLLTSPGETQPRIDLDQSKHFIDTIAMLEAKTRGNCLPEEVEMFEHILHELRMAYVAIQERAAGSR